MVKGRGRPLTEQGFPKARHPIDRYNPETLEINPLENLETNEGEKENNENRTEIVKEKLNNKHKKNKEEK